MRRMLDAGAGRDRPRPRLRRGQAGALRGAGRARGRPGWTWRPSSSPGAAREVDLVLGDLRRLPFRKGGFPRAYSLDVLEHLDEAGRARGAARGAARPGAARAGSSSTPTPWSRRAWPRSSAAVNRLARRLGRGRPHRPRARGDAQERPPQRDPQPRALRRAVRGGGAARGRAPLLQRRLQGGGRGPRAAALRAGRRTSGRRTARGRHGHEHVTGTRTATPSERRRRRGRARGRRRARADLAPQARRGPLRRRPHRARSSACCVPRERA